MLAPPDSLPRPARPSHQARSQAHVHAQPARCQSQRRAACIPTSPRLVAPHHSHAVRLGWAAVKQATSRGAFLGPASPGLPRSSAPGSARELRRARSAGLRVWGAAAVRATPSRQHASPPATRRQPQQGSTPATCQPLSCQLPRAAAPPPHPPPAVGTVVAAACDSAHVHLSRTHAPGGGAGGRCGRPSRRRPGRRRTAARRPSQPPPLPP
jgi:hypothetical protein